MSRMSLRIGLAAMAFAGVALTGATALAWGATGHRMIGVLAVEALPAELPAFLRTPQAAEQVGELAREPDRWKGSGRLHDSDRDPAHFANLDDEGRLAGGVVLDNLPPTRAGFEAAVAAGGGNLEHLGYLPYAMIDGWQQLVKDLAYWRADQAGAKGAPDADHRAWLARDAVEREQLVLRDLGVFAHYVGDGSQPLHVTIHYNGWGAASNPEGYTTARTTHSNFEGFFVRANLTPDAVRGRMAPFSDCRCSLERRVTQYLATTREQVEPFYRLEKAGGFQPGDKRGVDFAADRLAAGASELRDLVVLAWRASGKAEVGYPAIAVNDIEAGRVDPYDAFYGQD
jgi:hypothetical protein